MSCLRQSMGKRDYNMVWIIMFPIHLLIVQAGPVANTTVKTKLKDNESLISNPMASRKYVPVAVLKNCSIVPTDRGIPGFLKDSNVKLIKYNIILDDNASFVSDSAESLLFKPLYWVRTYSREGTGLLLLRNEFDVLSLTALSIGVSEVDVRITESPRNCLGKLGLKDAEAILREIVINNFKNVTSDEAIEMSPNEYVCNMHLRDADGKAEFRYYCCQRDSNRNINCKYLYEDIWLLILFYIIGVLKLIVILYSPRFVPGSYYREKFVAAPYIHKVRNEKKLELSIVLTKYPEQFNKALIKFGLPKFRYMKEFKNTIQTLHHDIPYKLSLEDIHIRIKAARLLPEDYAPVGLLESLYETLVKCNIRKREALRPCCSANVCLTSPCQQTVTWQRLVREIMKMLSLVTLITPWLIRVAIYYNYEHTEMDMRKKAADDKNLGYYFPGNFTLLLTPLHLTFVCIYFLLSIESCVYGVMRRRVKEKFKFVLRKCFRDMRERRRSGIIGWAVKLALKPCTQFGGFGLFIGIIVWIIGFPFIAIILAFYMIPTLNVTLRLLAHFFVYLMPRDICKHTRCNRLSELLRDFEQSLNIEEITSEENLEKNETALKTGRGRFQQLIVIVLCLISLYSIIFLITEVVSFGVEILIHTMIGIILNASVTLTYVSLILLLALYANDCFGLVSKTFLAYNKALNGMILGLGKEKCEKIIYTGFENQDNIAFRVSMPNSKPVDHPIGLIKDPAGYPRWRISRLLLFLSKSDIPHIPKSFFFAACKMPFYAAPGELLLLYIKAAIEFGAILVFLVFVLVVVLAFGDTYEISASNQLLATVAGGFVPFMLRKVVFKAHTTPTVDTTNINFQACLTDLIEKYNQSWPIHDIIVKQPTRLERQQSVYFDCKPDQELIDGDPEPNVNSVNASETSALTGYPANISEQLRNTEIDLLIDVNEIDPDDFPDMIEPSDKDQVDFS